MTKKILFHIEGMDCAACVINIDGMLEETAGIKSAKTSYAKSQTEVEFDPEKISEKQIASYIKQAGYMASK